jgi:hypothetical protein
MRVFVVIALVTEVATIILFQLLLPPPPLRVQCRTHCVGASSPGHHAAFLLIVAEAFWGFQSGRTRGLEVLGGDCSRYGRGVGALDVCGIGNPSGGAKGGVVEGAGVDVDKAFADAIFYGRKVGSPELV